VIAKYKPETTPAAWKPGFLKDLALTAVITAALFGITDRAPFVSIIISIIERRIAVDNPKLPWTNERVGSRGKLDVFWTLVDSRE
jgi:hypothetical protein